MYGFFPNGNITLNGTAPILQHFIQLFIILCPAFPTLLTEETVYSPFVYSCLLCLGLVIWIKGSNK